MATFFGFLTCLFVILAILDHGEKLKPVEMHTYNVERVFQMQPGRYTFLVRDNNQLISVDPKWGHEYPWDVDFSLRDDVSSEKPMYVQTTEDPNTKKMSVDIHVHSIQDIGTAGYRTNGKGSYQVFPEVVE
jgi:hypothetical protein